MIRTYQYNCVVNNSCRRSKSAFSYAIFTQFSASTFTGKELDAETGYGYFGARYYDPTLLTGWTAVDPMSDKYPNISPYAYCAWNPVKLVDPNGREWDLSALSTQQQELFNSNMNGLCERSPLFNEIYCALSESEVVYKPNIGETQSDDIDAQYNPKDHTFTFVDESSLSSGHAYIEEMIHAYQLTENSNKYDASLDFNCEFEAKVIKNLIQWESGGVAPIPGMESMQSIIQNDYEFGSKLDFSTITSESFANAYRTNANNYATYNIMNNIGNSNYHTPTNQPPASLNLLLQKVRP